MPLRTACLASFLALVACGQVRSTPAARPIVATAVLESARVDVSVVHRSCSGHGLCREDTVDARDLAAIEELDDDCRHRGGTPSSTRCVRDGAIASCSVNGSGLGAVTVLAYGDDVARVASHCEEFEGIFELHRVAK